MGPAQCPWKKSAHPQMLRNGKSFPLGGVRNAPKQLLKNQGAQWSHVGTVFPFKGRPVQLNWCQGIQVQTLPC